MSGREEAGTGSRTVLVIVAAGLAAVAGVVLLAAGLVAFTDASETRDRAAVLRRDRIEVDGRIRTAERGADSPIDQAEQVAASVSDIVEAGDTVIGKSAATSTVLQRAVQLANAGDLGGADQLYRGDAAASVRELNDELARARAALAAAQAAVAALTGTGS